MAPLVSTQTRFAPLTKEQLEQWGGSVIGTVENFIVEGTLEPFGPLCFIPQGQDHCRAVYTHSPLFSHFPQGDIRFFMGVKITLDGDELHLEPEFPPLANPEDKAKCTNRAPVEPPDSPVCQLEKKWRPRTLH